MSEALSRKTFLLRTRYTYAEGTANFRVAKLEIFEKLHDRAWHQ